jgi:predicted acetyltransferase
MTRTTIRELQGDEVVEVMHPLTNYAFHASPPLPDKDEWKEFVKGREGITCFALFEGKNPVACVASDAMTQNVRGALFGMGGVWGVATHPAARRKGYCRRLIARLLVSIHESGQPLSGLYPFRESFYERLGYTTFPLPRKARFAPEVLAPLVGKDLGGTVELMLIGDGLGAYRDYLCRMRQRTHGMAVVDFAKTFSAQRNRHWLALAKIEGEVAGLMLYDLKGEGEGQFRFRAVRFYYDTSQARYLLLQWIAHHIGQANQIELWLAPYELPETWLADMQITAEMMHEGPMGRIVDVARIGGMRSGPGRFTARVADPLCPWNEGVWQFETVDGALRVSAARKADCDLGIQALAAFVYGTRDPGDFAFRGWGNPPQEVQATMRAMFSPLLPHMHEMF